MDDFFIFVSTLKEKKMKKYKVLILFLLSITIGLAQKKETIKGSKIVTVEQKEISDFDTLEVGDNIEVYLDRGEKSELKIEADENLHSIITIDSDSNTLRVFTSKKAVNYKKLIVRITYTNNLNMITAKNEAVINAIQEIQLNEITIKTYDNSKLYLNVNANTFILQSTDKSKTELNLKSENTLLELSKYSELKALITSDEFKCDLYQKSKVTIEGDVNKAIIRLDNNAQFTGSNFVLKNANLITESYSRCSVNVSLGLSIEASGSSEIQLFGVQKIEMKKFIESAKLIKKPTK